MSPLLREESDHCKRRGAHGSDGKIAVVHHLRVEEANERSLMDEDESWE